MGLARDHVTHAHNGQNRQTPTPEIATLAQTLIANSAPSMAMIRGMS